MHIAHQLAFGCQLAQRGLLKNGIITADGIKHFRFQHHIARIDDSPIVDAFFTERLNRIVLADIQHAFLLFLHHGGQSCQLAMLLMELDQFGNVHIADAITIGHHKGFVADIFLHPLDAAARHRVQAGIHHRHAPRLGVLVMHDHLVALGEVKGHIAGMQEIIRKPLLDHMLLVPGADHKIIEAIVRILFHDMPQNGHTADFDHRFRLELTFFRNARAIAAGKNYNFHIFHSRKPAAEPCLQSRKNCPSNQHFNRRTVWYTPSLFLLL